MVKLVAVAVGLSLPGLALACGGSKGDMAKNDVKAPGAHAALADKDPSATAKKADLVGANCSYTTGMMAQRVLAEGTPWNYTGTLSSSENALDSHVASPYTVGPGGSVNVVATEVLESLTEQGAQGDRLSLSGKRLEVDGVTYFVLTSYAAPQS